MFMLIVGQIKYAAYHWAEAWQSPQNMRPTKTQINLGILPVRSVSSLCAQCVAKDTRLLYVGSEDSELTGWMSRLIWVFAGRTGHFVGFVVLWLVFFFSPPNNFDMHMTEAEWSFVLYSAYNCTTNYNTKQEYNKNTTKLYIMAFMNIHVKRIGHMVF